MAAPLNTETSTPINKDNSFFQDLAVGLRTRSKTAAGNIFNRNLEKEFPNRNKKLSIFENNMTGGEGNSKEAFLPVLPVSKRLLPGSLRMMDQRRGMNV